MKKPYKRSAGNTKGLLRRAIARSQKTMDIMAGSHEPACLETFYRAAGRKDAFEAAIDSLNGNKSWLRFYGNDP